MTDEEYNDEEENGKRKPDRTMEIRHVFEKGEGFEKSKSKDLSEYSREELETIIEADSLKRFDEEKEALLEQFPESQRDAISDKIGDDPTKLEQFQTALMAQGKQSKRRPTGKATLEGHNEEEGDFYTEPYSDLPYPKSHETYNYFRDMYRKLKDPTTPEKEKQLINKKLNETFDTIRKGLRRRSRNNPFRMPSVMMQCPNCNRVVAVDLELDPCPFCGFQYGRR